MPRTTRKLIAALAGGAILTVGGLTVAAADETGGRLRDRFCATDAAGWQAEQEARRADYVADVATELGIDPAELESAMRTVGLDRLDERLAEAVTAGRLTQAEADEMRAAAENGELRPLLEERYPQLVERRERIREVVCG
jgi:hypothetical protein